MPAIQQFHLLFQPLENSSFVSDKQVLRILLKSKPKKINVTTINTIKEIVERNLQGKDALLSNRIQLRPRYH